MINNEDDDEVAMMGEDPVNPEIKEKERRELLSNISNPKYPTLQPQQPTDQIPPSPDDKLDELINYNWDDEPSLDLEHMTSRKD